MGTQRRYGNRTGGENPIRSSREDKEEKRLTRQTGQVEIRRTSGLDCSQSQHRVYLGISLVARLVHPGHTNEHKHEDLKKEERNDIKREGMIPGQC